MVGGAGGSFHLDGEAVGFTLDIQDLKLRSSVPFIGGGFLCANLDGRQGEV